MNLKQISQAIKIEYERLRYYIYDKNMSLQDILDGKIPDSTQKQNRYTSINHIHKITGINRQLIKKLLMTKTIDEVMEYAN